MRCPITPELWQNYSDTGDVRVAEHLAICATCRAEAARFALLGASLASLPVQAAPAEVSARLRELEAVTRGQALTCRETLTLLEAWREGELAAAQAFLLEDHLLGCDPCSMALARAEALTVALHTLPRIEAPVAVAERIALGRIPWWQRLLPSAPTSWSRQFSYAVATMAAIVLLVLTSTMRTPLQVKNPPKSNPPRIAATLPTLSHPAEPSSPISTDIAPERPVKPTIHVRIEHTDNKPATDASNVPHANTENHDTNIVPISSTPKERANISVEIASAAPDVVSAPVEPRIVRAKIDNDLTNTDDSRDACITAASLNSSQPRVMAIGL